VPTLNVTVTRVAYPPATSDPDAWYILVTNQCTCKGKMSWRPNENDALVLEGEWAVYKGEREFSFKAARIDVPTNPRDQLHYVCCRTKGMGDAMEALIWANAGANWTSIQSGAVPRLSGRIYENFLLQIEAMRGKSEEANVVAYLMARGATMNMACKAWAMWGRETLGVVNSDPYRLADLEGYGFRDVDAKIRQHYGIGDDDRRRISAAVIYSLRRLTDRGDTVVTWQDLYAQATGLLGGYADEISDCTKDLFEKGELKAFPESEGVSLASDWTAENDIWSFVNQESVSAANDAARKDG
jgi:exodeoxyribonuclease V alpha subunit